jgi:hypothetical protein
MNWNLSVNNAQAWNTVGGKTFTSSDGLTTTAYTQLSYSFTCPSTTNFNIHVGAHSNTAYGQATQTAGTSYIYGWQILVKAKTTTLASNLSVDGTLATTGDVTFNTSTSLASFYSAITSLRSSGTFASTTAFQTIYNLVSPQCGFIRVTTYISMMVAMFEWSNGTTAASLTLIASSGNAVQAALNTTNTGTGTQYISLQLSGTSIQVKTTSNMSVTWYVTIL